MRDHTEEHEEEEREELCGCHDHEDHEHGHHDHDCCGHEDHEHEDHSHHDHGCSCGCHSHHHEHGHTHSHTHRHGEEGEEDEEAHERREKAEILIGAGLFALAVILHLVLKEESYSWPLIVIFVIAYLILGRNVLRTSLDNIRHGEIFDENFLMSVATLAAFAIQEYPEACGVMLFFRIGEMFEEAASERSRRQIMEAVDMRPETVTLLRDGRSETIAAQDVRPGDRIEVRPGERIPLDGTVLEGESFLDTSAVTGEPVPVRIEAGSSVLSGCVNTSGRITLRADKALSESMVSRILRSVEQAEEQKPEIEHFITRFARVYTPIVVGIALFTALVIPLLWGNHEFKRWIYTAVSFLVMSCPCALVVSVPLAFFCGIGTASGRGILFKGGSALEVLASARAAVLDKTGTITRGAFTVTRIDAAGMEEAELLRLAAAAESASSHPIALSISARAAELELAVPKPEEVKETPGYGIEAVLEGRRLFCGNRKLLVSAGVAEAALPPAGADNGTEVLLARDGQYLGRILIADAVKEDAPAGIARLQQQGFHTVMLTGDTEAGAKAIAAETGIGEVHAHLLPDDKYALMTKVRKDYGPVLFVGDGINDAPVLAGADVGAAMGSGADAAIEAADIVFMNSSVSAIPEAVDIARRSVRIARENVIGALAIKIIVMILGITGIYTNMWLAVFADTGVLFLCILNSIRLLVQQKKA